MWNYEKKKRIQSLKDTDDSKGRHGCIWFLFPYFHTQCKQMNMPIVATLLDKDMIM